jgi:glyoxalase-like protein
VRGLDAAVAAYRGLGFQVGARNRHPAEWGTQNHVVQLAGSYIELLALADTSGMAPHGPRYFSFGAFNRDFLSHREGPSMLVLEGRGAADAEEFRGRGISQFDLFQFEREAKRPDGTPITLGFTLAFAADPKAPDTGFFTSKHRQREAFWNPAFQQHPNGATRVAGVVMVADEPRLHRDFLLAFSGGQLADNAGVLIKTPRGNIEVVTPAAYKQRFELPAPDASNGLRLAAIRFAGEKLVAGRKFTFGAGLIFETG